MKNFADFLTLDYGNANISFFNIQIDGQKQASSNIHKHIYYEFHFSFDTVLKVDIDEKRFEIPKNSLFIIPPNAEHSCIIPKNTDEKQIVIALSIEKTQKSGDFHSSIISALNQNSLMPISFNAISKEELSAFNNEELYHNLLGICKLKAIASQFIFKILTDLSKENNEIKAENDIYILIDNMIQYRDFTLEEIAKETNYSKRHVSRIIKSRYGMSLSKLRKEQNR